MLVVYRKNKLKGQYQKSSQASGQANNEKTEALLSLVRQPILSRTVRAMFQLLPRLHIRILKLLPHCTIAELTNITYFWLLLRQNDRSLVVYSVRQIYQNLIVVQKQKGFATIMQTGDLILRSSGSQTLYRYVKAQSTTL